MGCLAVIGGLIVFVITAALIGPIPAFILFVVVGLILLLIRR